MGIYNATGRPGNEVDFTVRWCQPPNPNPDKRGCYRSELALQRDVQSTLIDWSVGVGSSERWFGFSNRLLNFSFDDTTPLNGWSHCHDCGPIGLSIDQQEPTSTQQPPLIRDRYTQSPHTHSGRLGPSFQIHAGNGTYTGKHPVLNLQVDSTGCALSNRSCPRWTLGVSAGGQPNPACSELYDACWSLGAAAKSGSFDGWNDWVIQWRGSPDPARGHVGVWRNGEVVLPLTTLATAYNDTVGPYPKFGVYRGSWKEMTPVAPTAKTSSIAYGALRVGDAHSSFDEVSTAVKGTESPQ